MNMIKKLVLGAALGASALTAAAPASAQYYRGYHGYRGYGGYRGGNDAGVAIGAGVLGLALGAAIASNSNRRYDRGYYYDRPYNGYYEAYPRYNDDRYYRPHPRHCFTDRSFDEYSGTVVTVQHCR